MTQLGEFTVTAKSSCPRRRASIDTVQTGYALVFMGSRLRGSDEERNAA